MSKYRHHGIDQDAAERLLRGDFGDPRTAPGPLVDLLAAAAAPARRDELAGEQAALTAFREARLTPADRPRRGSMIKPALAKLLTAKIALAAAATTAVGGGVVVAAETGNLPAIPGGSSHTSQPTPSDSESGRPAPAGAHGTDGNASPSPSMFGLCHAYTAGVADSKGKALDNPAFSVLIANAGGQDKVAAYCETVLAQEPGAHPTGQSGEHKPTSHPTGADEQPSTHATAQSGDHKPTSHPTAEPTGTPSHP